ncbi:hypothetical protein HMPREF9319_1995 [Streptococcus equinus ATCC 700338]|uniref:Uncharacterized protein n=1 Tax=Streptococcus equinus ATCC 700338 TaxID=864569 RepID=E0PGE9_STREI|nr:hypothetical protein HMPREF9319_1995 [Streptococcus equinus ATCC 700338]
MTSKNKKSNDAIKLTAMTFSTANTFTIKLKRHNKQILPKRLMVDLKETRDEILSIDTILLK